MRMTKHFSFCGAHAVELARPFFAHLAKDYARLTGSPYAGEKLVRNAHLFACGYCPLCDGVHATVRKVEYSSNPSNHLCNAACMFARGPLCECSCGGLNHGGAGYNPNQNELFTTEDMYA